MTNCQKISKQLFYLTNGILRILQLPRIFMIVSGSWGFCQLARKKYYYLVYPEDKNPSAYVFWETLRKFHCLVKCQ